MYGFLKQGAPATFRMGPVVDTDGEPVTGETPVSADIYLAKAGGPMASKADGTAPSHDQAGIYSVTLGSGDLDTLGLLRVDWNPTGGLQVWDYFMVLPANVYDSIVAGTDYLDSQVAGMNADVLTVDVLQDDAIAAAKIASNAFTSDAFATSFYQELFDYDASSHMSASTLGKVVENADTPLSGMDTKLDTIAGYVDTEVAAILTAIGAPSVDLATDIAANLAAIAALNDPTAAAVADAVWDEAASGHVNAGSFGETLATWFTEMTEDDGGTRRFTTNALEQGPGGGAASAYKVQGSVVEDENGRLRWIAWVEKGGAPQTGASNCRIDLWQMDGDGTITDLNLAQTVASPDAHGNFNAYVSPTLEPGVMYKMRVRISADATDRVGFVTFFAPLGSLSS